MAILTNQRIGGPPGGINQVKVELTQAEIQSLNTTPIEAIAAPGAGKYIQLIYGSAFLNHNGTSYTVASSIRLKYTTGAYIREFTNLILQASDHAREMYLNGGQIQLNEPILISADADAVGAGGTITVWIQYTVIDTN